MRKTDGFSDTFIGLDVSPEAVEFGKAMDRHKRERQRPFPTCSEVLAVLRSLGYRKEASPEDLECDHVTHPLGRL
jgi:hypothetical protein